MLVFLCREGASDRKLRLFGCACCRQVWHQMTSKRSRNAVETAERYANGECDRATLQRARRAGAARARVFGGGLPAWEGVNAMDEPQWLACTDHPYPMLEYLDDRVSDRKLMLFSVACLRRIWDLLADRRSRALIDATERMAD